MEDEDGNVEVDNLERGLLHSGNYSNGDEDHDDEDVLCTASFAEVEEKFVKYQTTLWVLYSLLFILAWGVGLLMLLYLPVRRYIIRKDFRSRKLYVTSSAIIYKVVRPVPFPCFGVLKREKHVILPSVADIAIEQGYLQSICGVYSIRIENTGIKRPPGDDVQILGVANPHAFKKAVMTHLSNMRNKAFSKQVSTVDDVSNLRPTNLSPRWMSPSKSLKYENISHHGEIRLFQKLEEVDSSVKRLQTLIEAPSNAKSF